MTSYPADNVEAFWKVLDPSDNATGGGTASATAGAMAAGLTAMVGRLSLGKDLQPDAFYEPIIAEAQALAVELFDGARIDSQAFEQVMAAFKLPKDTDEAKAARSQANQAGWQHAARVPLVNAQRCHRVSELAGMLENKSNPDAGSDLFCAIQLAQAGKAGCIANVQINLPSIKDDATKAALLAALAEIGA